MVFCAVIATCKSTAGLAVPVLWLCGVGLWCCSAGCCALPARDWRELSPLQGLAPGPSWNGMVGHGRARQGTALTSSSLWVGGKESARWGMAAQVVLGFVLMRNFHFSLLPL